MLQMVRDSEMVDLPLLNDDYIERMANYYTSEAAQVIHPYLHKIPFEKWLYRQYFLDFEKLINKGQSRVS
jgi:hypothetical protein